MWVFRVMWKQENKKVFEVGYYDTLASDGTGGNFIVLYEFDARANAAQQVHFLNGGN